MSPIWLSEEDVSRLLPPLEAIRVLEEAFRAKAAGEAINVPRTRVVTPEGVLHVMSAGWTSGGVMGLKAYTTSQTGARFVVLLYATDGRLLAGMEANVLGQRRTGAASGLATRYMGRRDASVVAVIGSGWQARTQLAAVCAVRPIREARVYSRTPQRREAFAREMLEQLGILVRAVGSGEEAVAGADVICTITTAREPVLWGRWLHPGVHINAAGVNWPDRRELDGEAVRRAHRIAVDDLAQARLECGDLIQAEREGVFRWEQAVELSDIVAGKVPGRGDPQEITLFASQGIALEDVAVAKFVYERAREEGAGRPFAAFDGR
ncbi:MAG: ornithine cyclodeaminase family protein [Armatimonadota bacterium]|nr:ornithine cyclodeaminase family protein [Armatimonadota bacterium]MDR7439951.1 ornithine cyclodeaminase family protein [Armatimonadota bacterium]MDR7562384.1 ornithine cyclodeaminase family protein [Armatimonadota bacterium]MDR7567069.1 ornithine cyclodeaminase family protein [Armatimonadota bacterium]MDR7601534.1 ornithine cyclodeaminase family protein [Armatimonadota bacterium]